MAPSEPKSPLELSLWKHILIIFQVTFYLIAFVIFMIGIAFAKFISGIEFDLDKFDWLHALDGDSYEH